jgi:hypothetical protein
MVMILVCPGLCIDMVKSTHCISTLSRLSSVIIMNKVQRHLSVFHEIIIIIVNGVKMNVKLGKWEISLNSFCCCERKAKRGQHI